MAIKMSEITSRVPVLRCLQFHVFTAFPVSELATGRAVRTSLRGSELAAISNSGTEERILAKLLKLQGLTSHALNCHS